ncbi:hypothetical protein [Pseudaquidulcibacter saccharophilus]|uniref:hypothetical protein n=1 Tax=Pseudaquidulcibacter saccharophilus TaxID=2831900 RepID=UPI001EFF1F6A|nr:hypothetical protein [Pseudaquidulcibacter saccharophilus]
MGILTKIDEYEVELFFDEADKLFYGFLYWEEYPKGICFYGSNFSELANCFSKGVELYEKWLRESGREKRFRHCAPFGLSYNVFLERLEEQSRNFYEQSNRIIRGYGFPLSGELYRLMLKNRKRYKSQSFGAGAIDIILKRRLTQICSLSESIQKIKDDNIEYLAYLLREFVNNYERIGFGIDPLWLVNTSSEQFDKFNELNISYTELLEDFIYDWTFDASRAYRSQSNISDARQNFIPLWEQSIGLEFQKFCNENPNLSNEELCDELESRLNIWNNCFNQKRKTKLQFPKTFEALLYNIRKWRQMGLIPIKPNGRPKTYKQT